jgi:hypothetical protein
MQGSKPYRYFYKIRTLTISSKRFKKQRSLSQAIYICNAISKNMLSHRLTYGCQVLSLAAFLVWTRTMDGAQFEANQHDMSVCVKWSLAYIPTYIHVKLPSPCFVSNTKILCVFQTLHLLVVIVKLVHTESCLYGIYHSTDLQEI